MHNMHLYINTISVGLCVCSWTTSGLKSQGRLSVGSNRDREISMAVGLGRSKLDSKGGVVGGNIDVNTLEMVCKYTPWKQMFLFCFAFIVMSIIFVCIYLLICPQQSF